ncbi:MAG: hypothetical protein MI674_04370 [Cytophagales bacterium]|nr:hypothetical protein [Cytophagales bacterium]
MDHVSNTPSDLVKKISVNGATIFHRVKSYLFERYQFRFNTVKKQYEVSPIGLNNYQEINEDELHIEVNEAGIKISLANLVSLLKSGICEDYNPIQAYFSSYLAGKKEI